MLKTILLCIVSTTSAIFIQNIYIYNVCVGKLFKSEFYTHMCTHISLILIYLNFADVAKLALNMRYKFKTLFFVSPKFLINYIISWEIRFIFSICTFYAFFCQSSIFTMFENMILFYMLSKTIDGIKKIKLKIFLF